MSGLTDKIWEEGLPSCPERPPGALEAEGWTRSFRVRTELVDRYLELYRKLGYGVHAIPTCIPPRPECDGCPWEGRDMYRTVYTRRA